MTDTAYFVSPVDGPGPGVLLLHSWWGLTESVKRTADHLSDEGYTVLAPDLNFGPTFTDPEVAREHLARADADRLASLTLASARIARERSASPDRPIGVVGFSMGASLGLWASVRIPEAVSAVVAYYGTQSIDFAGSRSAYLVHLAATDDLVSDDDAAFMEATIALEDRPVEVVRHPDTRHFFAEESAEAYDPGAAAGAWERTLAFLRTYVGL